MLYKYQINLSNEVCLVQNYKIDAWAISYHALISTDYITTKNLKLRQRWSPSSLTSKPVLRQNDICVLQKVAAGHLFTNCMFKDIEEKATRT
jgi:hypothetical protein